MASEKTYVREKLIRERVIHELVEYIESALAVDSDYVDRVPTDLLQIVVGIMKQDKALISDQAKAIKILKTSTIEKSLTSICGECKHFEWGVCDLYGMRSDHGWHCKDWEE